MSLLSSVMAQIIRAVAPPVGGEYHELVLDAAPLGYWRMDETSGTTLVDATTGNDGVISGTYTLDIAPTAEVTGRAIKFTNAGVVPASIGTLPTGGAGGWCAEFLVKLFTADSPANAYILLRQNSGDVVFHFGGANRIGIFKSSGAGGTVASNAFGPTIPRDDAWHHVVIGWNPTDSRYEAYLDGVLDSFYVRTAPTLNNTIFRIGQAGPSSAPFVGGLDEFAVYDRFLTPTEIADHAYRALVGPL